MDRFVAPEAMQLNDVAIAPDGSVYTTDSESGTVFRKKPDERTLTRLGETGGVRGANGIAFSSDGILYVTLSTGIARVDTATGAVTRLPQPDTVVTGGIDGLYWHVKDNSCLSDLSEVQAASHDQIEEIIRSESFIL